ncbi:MAG: hypothetical protein AB7I27_16710 [Bacteriovoracaceae bacterium]
MRSILLILLILFTSQAFANITINAAEFGLGKFHRYSNKKHPYGSAHAWSVFILPDNAETSKNLIKKNSNDNYTIFFNDLESLLKDIIALTQKTGMKVEVLNLHAHGLPGSMWFPRDAEIRSSIECASWNSAASGPDVNTYKSYYSPVSKSAVLGIEASAEQASSPRFQCLTGLSDWKTLIAKNPSFKDVFAQDGQVHMLSCVVGLGEKFTSGLAKLLFPEGGTQRVITSIKFGLGDWSMSKGMGFWYYENDEQIKRDSANYPVQQQDSLMAQKGDLRVAEFQGSKLVSGIIPSVNEMIFSWDNRKVVPATKNGIKSLQKNVKEVILPGTNVRIKLFAPN